jgi:predicted acylesterase/phospholipase RssA
VLQTIESAQALRHDSTVTSGLARLRQAKKIGFVFCGGASRCAFQIGVVEALTELGIEPSLTVGVSAGAWNAAIVSARIIPRIRPYWHMFMRMPHIDLRNLFVEHSPWRFRTLHQRTFARFIGRDRFRQPDALPMFISVTRLSDRANQIFDARDFDDPLDLLMATNFLMPFFTHPPVLFGERYADGGMSNNAPYDKALAEGCDAVVMIAMKGESEGGIFKNTANVEHVIPPDVAPKVIVIRPRHRLPVAFTERRWPILSDLADLGYLRTREVLLGEQHAATDVRAHGEAPTAKAARILRGVQRVFARQAQ